MRGGPPLQYSVFGTFNGSVRSGSQATEQASLASWTGLRTGFRDSASGTQSR
jgi:hypothetical protein